MIKKIFNIFVTALFIVPLHPSIVCSAEGVVGISAKSYVLIEKNTGEIIYEKNAYEKLPIASTTKIMTTLLCLESGELDKLFIVDSEAIKTEGSSMGLCEGDTVTKRALCIGMLLPSGNDAANATAIKLAGSYEKFADMMNKRAEQIGMTRTCFVTPSGLDAPGHGSSAYDMSLLAREALKNEDFKSICSQQSIKLQFGNPPFDRWLKNTNKLLSMCDGVYGVKTGFTDEAGRCLVSACERNGVSLICVTLNDPSDWNDHSLLYERGFSEFEEFKISPSGLTVNVVGGKCDTIPLCTLTPLSVGVRCGTIPQLTEKKFIKHFLYAPVEKGTYAGYIDYYNDDIFVGRVYLYTDISTDLYTPKNTSTLVKIKKYIKNFLKRSNK